MATPLGVSQTKEMCDSADLIFAGRTEKFVIGPGPAATFGGKGNSTYVVKLEKIIKNSTGVPFSNVVTINSRQAKNVSLAAFEGNRAMFFAKSEKPLKNAKDQKSVILIPADERHISLPLSPASDCPVVAGKPPVDIVAVELVKVLETPAAKLNTIKLPLNQSFGKYRDNYNYSGTLDQAAVEYDHAADALRSIPVKVAVPLLVKAVHNNDMRCQLRAVHALALLKNFEYVSAVEKVLMDPPKTVYFDVAQLANHLNIEDRKYVPLLQRLAKSKDPRVKKAAKDSLAAMGQP